MSVTFSLSMFVGSNIVAPILWKDAIDVAVSPNCDQVAKVFVLHQGLEAFSLFPFNFSVPL